MHKKNGSCYLCMKFNNVFEQTDSPLQEHHVVFGSANRKLSEKYGLKVYLCPWHHLATGGPDAVHRNKNTKLYLCKEAQKSFEREYPTLSFREIFGINYLDDEDRENQAGQQDNKRFIPIEDGLEDLGW